MAEASSRVLEGLSANLYEVNGFRLTGLPVTATARQVERRVDQLRIRERFGTGAASAANTEQLRDAVLRLREPGKRLLDEFFWFWPLSATDPADPALSAATPEGEAEAARLWRQNTEDPRVGGICQHNLAVLTHRTALGSTVATAEGAAAWEEAFRKWHDLLNREVFWSALTARIKELDDPRLTVSTGRGIRTDLPVALMKINAQLALKAAERGEKETAKWHVAAMRDSEFSDAAGEALRGVLEPVRARIKLLCEQADQDAGRDVRNSSPVVVRLLDQCIPLLDTVRLLLPADDLTRQGLCDAVALEALGNLIAYGNKTDDWWTAEPLIERIVPLAASESARKRAETNKTIITNNRKRDSCFFCGKSRGSEKHMLKQKMYGDVVHDNTRTRWKWREIEIARCERCAQAHVVFSRLAGAGIVVGLLSCVAALFTLNWVSDVVSAGWPLLTFLLTLPVIFLIPTYVWRAAGLVGLGETRLLAERFQHPSILERQEQGWKFGEDPPGVEISTGAGRWGRWLAGREFFARRASGRMPVVVFAAAWLPLLWLLASLGPMIGGR